MTKLDKIKQHLQSWVEQKQTQRQEERALMRERQKKGKEAYSRAYSESYVEAQKKRGREAGRGQTKSGFGLGGSNIFDSMASSAMGEFGAQPKGKKDKGSFVHEMIAGEKASFGGFGSALEAEGIIKPQKKIVKKIHHKKYKGSAKKGKIVVIRL